MTSTAQRLPDILASKMFIVPDYQRPYAWQQRQLEDLWQDLDLMTDGAKHYTGTLVLKELDDQLITDAGDTLLCCEVVDGQQRLTTCLLLLHELEQALAGIDHELATSRAQNLANTYGPVAVGGLPQARLQLSEDLNPYWLNTILGGHQQGKPTLTEGEQRLRDAQTFFRARLAELVRDRDIGDALDVLQRLQTRLTCGLRFLIYDIEPTSHAGEIFETLNGRGRSLTNMEKIKNYLLFLANSAPDTARASLASQINRSWSHIYDLLARHGADEDTLLRSHWLATYQPVAKHWDGDASIKDRFAREIYIPSASRLSTRRANSKNPDSGGRLVKDIHGYVLGLEQCAMFTAEFLSRDAGYQSFNDSASAAAAGLSAARLIRTGVTAPFRPLLFAARLAHPTDGQLYIRLLDACERYAARVFVIGQRRSNSGVSRLYRLANDLYTGQVTPDDLIGKIDSLTWHYADDDTVSNGLAANVNWYARAAGHKYLLYEYELGKATRPSDVPPFETYATGDKRGRTTEHVLPQNPRPDTDDWNSFTPEEHAALVHSIGNLVLSDDNSAYSNHTFDRKKGSPQATVPCYATSRLSQERELTAYTDWTPQTIEQRRQHLLAWALERWHIDAPEATAVDVSEEDETTSHESLLHEDGIAATEPEATDTNLG